MSGGNAGMQMQVPSPSPKPKSGLYLVFSNATMRSGPGDPAIAIATGWHPNTPTPGEALRISYMSCLRHCLCLPAASRVFVFGSSLPCAVTANCNPAMHQTLDPDLMKTTRPNLIYQAIAIDQNQSQSKPEARSRSCVSAAWRLFAPLRSPSQ